MTAEEHTTPDRVRVTGPPRRRPPATRPAELDTESQLGGMYLHSLVREQLRLAIGMLLVLGLTIGALPILFHLLPDLAARRVLGMPLSWVVLGALVYPALVVLGWIYVRRAERNEHQFVELVIALDDEPDGPEQPQ